MYKNKKTGIIGVVVTVIILIAIVVISNIEIENFSQIGGALSSFVMPVQNGITYLKNKITGNNTFFSDIDNLKSENEQLKQENSELEQQLRELEILKAENKTLQEYLGIAQKYTQYKIVPAYIINKDITNYSSDIIINVGSKDGIKENMTVIANEGLVGHVISVTEDTAKVQVIISTANTVSAVISTSRDAIICRGIIEKDNSMKATYIPTDAQLIIGDNVETSGMGGIYQKGIFIGTIEEIVETKNITDRYAIIKAAVDFSKLETVGVIIEDNNRGEE